MDQKTFEAVIETAKENIFEVFGSVNSDMLEIIEGVLDRLDAEDFEDGLDDLPYYIANAIDDEMIWTYNQWQVMQNYQTPDEANYGEAIDCLLNDIMRLF